MLHTEHILKIAKFMDIIPIKGINVYTDEDYYYYYDKELEDYEPLPYYNTYEEIMPVVIKIESLGGDENEFDIFGNCVLLGDRDFLGETKLEAIIKAVNWWIDGNVK